MTIINIYIYINIVSVLVLVFVFQIHNDSQFAPFASKQWPWDGVIQAGYQKTSHVLRLHLKGFQVVVNQYKNQQNNTPIMYKV